MHKRVTLIGIIAIFLIGTGAIRMRVPLVFAQDPTIPTRTPIPDSNAPPPPQPTNPPAPTASGNEGSPAATNTPEPGQIVNPPPPAGQSTQTPDTSIPGGATAASQSGSSGIQQGERSIGIDPCDETPYIQALSRITVHAGPGLNYPVVSTLERDELRPITGRARFATWWQIQLRSNLLGWVLDEEVNEFGNTALVPIIDPPLLNGIAPTPGVLWEPTPVSFEPCLPTETPTSTNDGTTGAIAAGNEANAIQEGETEMTETAVAAAIVGDEEATPLPGSVDSTLAGDVGVTERGLEASRISNGSNNGLNLILPLVGIGLIAAGILLALLARNRSSTPPADAQPKES
jgi:hypothetical protein